MEVEIKLRVADRPAILRRLKRLKAAGGERVHEMNTLYDIPGGALAREGKLLRIRVEQPAPARGGKSPRKPRPSNRTRAAMLTYKGPVQTASPDGSFHGRRSKIREEHEVCVEDAAALARVFEGLGLRPWFRYEKYRSTYRLPGFARLLLEVDETPIGDFLELEGPPEAIDRCAALLDFRTADYIIKSYGALFLEQRQSNTSFGGPVRKTSEVLPDMLFEFRNGPTTATGSPLPSRKGQTKF
jgi:adenylate cyclase class 2